MYIIIRIFHKLSIVFKKFLKKRFQNDNSVLQYELGGCLFPFRNSQQASGRVWWPVLLHFMTKFVSKCPQLYPSNSVKMLPHTWLNRFLRIIHKLSNNNAITAYNYRPTQKVGLFVFRRFFKTPQLTPINGTSPKPVCRQV